MVKTERLYKSVDQVPVWKASHSYTIQVYEVTSSFPRDEQFSLTSQLRRCSSSVAANITEGFYRNSTKELLNFLYIARGSLGESWYFLVLAKDLGYIDADIYENLRMQTENVSKQLNGWIKSLKLKT